jgi:hypothetical protein
MRKNDCCRCYFLLLRLLVKQAVGHPHCESNTWAFLWRSTTMGPEFGWTLNGVGVNCQR